MEIEQYNIHATRCRTTEEKSNLKLPEGFGKELSWTSVEIGSISESDSSAVVYPLLTYKNWQIFPYGTFQNGKFENQLELVKNFKPMDGAVLLCSPMKSGSHWVFEILSMLLNESLIHSTITGDIQARNIEVRNNMELNELSKQPFIHSHLPLELLPISHVQRGGKIVYLNRNPKDIYASLYNWMTGKSGLPWNWNWDMFYQEFVLNDKLFTGWFNYTKGMTRAVKSKKANIFCLKYEELSQDPKVHVIKLANFLQKSFSEEFIDLVVEKCSFDNMKKNVPDRSSFSGTTSHFRKGKVGDWKHLFTVSQNEEYDEIYKREMENIEDVFTFE